MESVARERFDHFLRIIPKDGKKYAIIHYSFRSSMSDIKIGLLLGTVVIISNQFLIHCEPLVF